MPTPEQSRRALTLLTGAAVTEAQQILAADGPAALFDAVVPLIGYYSDGSSALAADFYDDERDAAGARGRYAAEPVVNLREKKLYIGTAWATETGIDAIESASRLAQVVQLETARPYRDTITTNRERDPEAVGWRRVSAGGCKFCAMLAGRGAIYRSESVRFASHTHCHCTAQPVFKANDTGEKADVIQYEASKRYRTEAEREKNNAKVRAYLNEHFPDVPG